MMAWAFTGPIPGRASSSSLVDVLIFTFWPGARFVAVLEAFSVDLAAFTGASFEGAANAGDAAAFPVAAEAAGAGAAEPTVTKGFMASIFLAERPAFDSSSIDLYGLPATIFLAVAGPTPSFLVKGKLT